MSEQPEAETPTLVIAPGAFANAASRNGCTIEGGIGPTFPRKRPTHSPKPFAN